VLPFRRRARSRFGADSAPFCRETADCRSSLFGDSEAAGTLDVAVEGAVALCSALSLLRGQRLQFSGRLGLTGPKHLAIIARMRQVSVTELKNQLSRYLRLVKRGETIEILERAVPVARLEGVPSGSRQGDGHLERLRRDGIILPSKRRARPDLSKEPPVPCRADAAQAVIDERGDR